ncbi:MAG: PAS domain S-box protein [Victivallales bacterium]|nr:PAS domain S-box protein [Victivallales bacterium]
MDKSRKKSRTSSGGSDTARMSHEAIFTDAGSGFSLDISKLSFPVFFKDMRLRYVFVNDSFVRFYGKEPEFFIGKSDEELFTEEELSIVISIQKDILSGKSACLSYEHPELDDEDEAHWFLTTVEPIRSPEGKIIGLSGISADICEVKVAETELSLLSTAVQHLSDIIVITDTQPVIQYVNPAFVEVTGYSVEEAVGKNPSILKSGMQNEAFYKKMWDTISCGKRWKGHFLNKRKDGSVYHEAASISPVFGTDGEIMNYVAVKRDISREAELEEQLQQAHKMEAIGRLAGGVAHDFNNILTVILGYSKIILEKLDSSDVHYKQVEEIHKAGQRAANLTKQMLAFSRRQVLSYTRMNLNSVMTELKGVLDGIVGEGVELVFDLAEKVDNVLSNRVQIEQIMMNLLTNARDAVDGKGKVSVSTGNVFLNDGFKNGFFEVPPGAYVELKVEDDGCGMDENTVKCMFEPFFTTKSHSCGTGLGLSTVYGIVKQHSGCIFVDSEPGKGSVFRVLIPSLPAGAGLPEEETDSGIKMNAGGASVLLVDDDKSVLDLAESILKFTGYSVQVADSGEGALDLFIQSDSRTDLLLTDVVLGGMSGVELAAKLRKSDSKLKVLFMSGFAGEALAGIDLSNPLNGFIEKPFSMNTLNFKVSALLKRGGKK